MPRIEVLTSNLLAASLFPRYRNSYNLLRMLCVSQVVKHMPFYWSPMERQWILFYLSAMHKAFYIDRGLALPTHSLDCRAVIKKNEKSDLPSVVGKLIESLKGQLISA